MRWKRGAAGRLEAGRTIRVNGIDGEKPRVSAIDSPRSLSGRCSTERDSGLEAGDAGSFERHMQDGAGDVAMLTPAADTTAGRCVDPGRDVTRDDGQQQTAQERLTQHASVLSCEAGLDVEASLTSDNVPRTAARATRESRRW